MKKPTMGDIAERLNVSKMTVSKCFKNSPDISKEMQDKVMRVAQEIGYIPPRRKRYNVVVLTKDEFLSKGDTFYTELHSRLNEQAFQRDLQLSLSVVKKDEENAFITHYGFEPYDGIMLMGQFSRFFVQSLQSLDLPMVLLDFYYHDIDIDSVVSNNFFGAFDATAHLIENNHRAIAFLGTLKATSSINDRYFGYFKAMLEAGLESNMQVIKDRNGLDIYRTFDLPNPLPSAFVCNNDHTAYLLIEQLKAMGKNVPGDISVTGFDDVKYSEISEPTITTIRVSRSTMAKEAIKSIHKKIIGTSDTKRNARRIALDCTLINRESTASNAADWETRTN